MKHYSDTVLLQSHQHISVLVLKIFGALLVYFAGLSIAFLLLGFSAVVLLILLCVGVFVICFWQYYFWVKSYFIVSSEKIVVKVRNGLFSKFHMSIHYKNIRDTAFSQNHVFHSMFGSGTFFARSSAGATGDLEARNIPNIEKVYKIINALHNIPEQERREITDLSILFGKNEGHEKKQETLEQIIDYEKKNLLSIEGIKEVVILTDIDRRYIFEHEEERNHGVHECLRREVLFAATHDSTFRDPDEAIVMKTGEKIVFPVVDFHEIKRKKVSSSSPGVEIHRYLEDKFQNLGAYDATLIIGFDT